MYAGLVVPDAGYWLNAGSGTGDNGGSETLLVCASSVGPKAVGTVIRSERPSLAVAAPAKSTSVKPLNNVLFINYSLFELKAINALASWFQQT